MITDHEALVSLLIGNNSKNKTRFSRLTRWLDRIIPFDFCVEQKPGAKIGLADYLARYSNSLAEPVSSYDSTFTVAKINTISKTYGFLKIDLSGEPEIKHQYAPTKQSLTEKDVICKFRTTKQLLRGNVACEKNSECSNLTAK